MDGLSLQSVEILVFDEADRLFELGFAEQLHAILGKVPESRQGQEGGLATASVAPPVVSVRAETATRALRRARPLDSPRLAQHLSGCRGSRSRIVR